MTKDKILTNSDEKEDNLIILDDARKVRQPLLAIHGKGSGPEAWLRGLIPGTIFLCKDNKNPNELALMLYMIVEHKAVSTNLLLKLQKNDQVELWVGSLEFSRRMTLVEVVGTVELQEKEVADVSDGTQQQPIEEKKDEPIS